MSDLLYKAAYLIDQHCSWVEWHDSPIGRSTFVNDLGPVTVVSKRAHDRVSESYYDDFPQGSEAVLGTTFKVEFDTATVRYFRKEGSADSYGSCRWDGSFVEVFETTKTITAYERV